MTLLQALTNQPQSELNSLSDQILALEQSIKNVLKKVPEESANLIGALFAHQNGVLLHYQKQIQNLTLKDRERNSDMQQLQTEMKNVIEAAENFQKEINENEVEIARLRE